MQDFSDRDANDVYWLEMSAIPALSEGILIKQASGEAALVSGNRDIQPLSIGINQGTFSTASRLTSFPTVSVQQSEPSLTISCTCKAPKGKLCEHQLQVLSAIMNRKELRIFFDQSLRHQAIKQVAKEYGLENESRFEDYFYLSYENKAVAIRPTLTELIPITQAGQDYLEASLLPEKGRSFLGGEEFIPNLKKAIVFTRHRHYDNFCLELVEAATTQAGKLKNPVKSVRPLDGVNLVDNLNELKFYAAIAKFQNQHRTKSEETDLDALRIVATNPLGLAVFLHSSSLSESITAHALIPVQLKKLDATLSLVVHQAEPFYDIRGSLTIDGISHGLDTLVIKYDYFILLNDTLYLLDNADYRRVIQFLGASNNRILIHQSRYEAFQRTILARLEDRILINYTYLKPATAAQLNEQGFNKVQERIIYLTDSADYVVITPVMKYGPVEVPVLSKRSIYSVDTKGKPFMVARDEQAEIQFTVSVVSEHPDFQNQLGQNQFFLHKKHFLDERWFLGAFESWASQQITILGFNKLKNNRLNPNKAKVSVLVSSGLDWFETSLGVYFGKQHVTLKHLHRAIKNKSKFVTLDDGTQGVLPTEWLDRFSAYFQAGDVVDDRIRTPKINFSGIDGLYDKKALTPEVNEQLVSLTAKFTDFQAIPPVPIPGELQATLRGYQKEGLNWLNFLDDLGFGGCLADDMGLGKTLQIIAFLLLQRSKKGPNTNLIVVPTSLLFNWQAEVEKFAPSLKMHTFYGANRTTRKSTFDQYDIILTSYGTMVADIRFLKDYAFNYTVLDESQAIKNPESQRYQAARLLTSRNKLVLTGTPIENHTFDLYGQLSFACPGLLGSYHYFRSHYSTPIDKFDDRKRSRELQQKIKPFILRRTKAQVATELPDKTEMIIHCEMGKEQRLVYDAYEREFRQFLVTTREGDIPRTRLHILQGLTKLRQICNSPILLNDEEFYGDSSAKIDSLIRQIETKSPQHKILIFSQFVTMLDLIKKELETRQISFEYLTGQSQNRAASVDRFQTDDTVRVFLISLKAGGVGLNLTQADYVYLVDPWWNPAVENQAIDRSYRIGQTKPVIAVRLICPNTIEEKIVQLQASKNELTDRLIKTDESMLKLLTKDDLLGLLS